MAFYSGTVSDYEALFDKIVEKALLQDWVIMEDERNTAGKKYIILKGVGDDGLQEIYVGIEKYLTTVSGINAYGFRLNGFTGYQAGVTYFNQAGAIPLGVGASLPTVPLWNAPIDYWLCINKRRIVFVAKVSTNYFAGYLGYLLPFATGNQFPYPLAIGGSNRFTNRYDDTANYATHFVIPYDQTLRMRAVDGTWRTFNLPTTFLGIASVYPYSQHVSGNFSGGFFNCKATPNTGGDIPPLQPVFLHEGFASNNYKGNIYGILDGCFHISGADQAVENIITIGGVDYLVVQNIFRTTIRDFWALKLA